MWIKRTSGASPTQVPRRHTRHVPKGVSCPLGVLTDLSAGGCRLRPSPDAKIKAGEAVKFKLRHAGGSESIAARVCWVRGALPWRKAEAGLKFMGTTVEQAGRLSSIARHGFVAEEELERQRAAEAAAQAQRDALREELAVGQRASGTGTGDGAGDAVGSEPKPDPSGESGGWSGDERRRNVRPIGDGTGGTVRAPLSPELMSQLVRETHLKTLGLEAEAPMDQVRSAYRRLVRTCHPDVAATPEAAQRFLALQTAYDALKREAA